jgi:hypothetical protein
MVFASKPEMNTMKVIILFSLFIVSANYLISQTLSERFGAVQTNFEFTSNNERLEIGSQQIVKRSGRFVHGSGDVSSASGYETLRLELEVANDIPFIRSRLLDGNQGFHLSFYSGNGEYLGFRRLYDGEVIRFRKDVQWTSPVSVYSFDLYSIPLIILDKTSRIEILRYMY